MSDVKLIGECLDSSLSIAVEKGYTEIARVLLVAGVDVNAVDNKDKTAFNYTDNPDVARLLMESGARTKFIITMPSLATEDLKQELELGLEMKNELRNDLKPSSSLAHEIEGGLKSVIKANKTPVSQDEMDEVRRLIRGVLFEISCHGVDENVTEEE